MDWDSKGGIEMDKKWLEVYEKLVNTDTSFELSIEEKLDATQFVADILKDMGFEVSRGRASHVAKMGDPPRVTLIGHLDTVFKRGEPSRRPFRVEEGVVKGPGVGDMKGGVVIMLMALEEALQGSKNLPLEVVLNVDEETGSDLGREDHLEAAKRSVFCLSFETGRKNGAVVIARKGIASLTVNISGRAGHASSPKSGANALIEMADKVLKVSELSSRFEKLTIVPTIASSGYKGNVIPDNAYIFFDVRYSALEEVKRLRTLLEDIFMSKRVEECEGYYALEIRRPPMKRDEKAVKLLEDVMRYLRVQYKMLEVGGGGDAAFYSQEGVPAIDGLGIVGRYIHSEKEEAYLDWVQPRVSLSIALLQRLIEMV